MPSQLIIINDRQEPPRYSVRQVVGSVWNVLEGEEVIATCDGEAAARAICGLLNRQRQDLAPQALPVVIGSVGLN